VTVVSTWRFRFLPVLFLMLGMLSLCAGGCSSTVTKTQTVISFCKTCGAELSRSDIEVKVEKAQLDSFQPVAEDRSSACPIKWDALSQCNLQTIASGAVFEETLVAYEPIITLELGEVPTAVTVEVNGLVTERSTTGGFQLRRLELLRSLTSTVTNPVTIPVVFRSATGELGTISTSTELGGHTYLSVTAPTPKTWSNLVKLSGTTSPGATVSCAGKSTVVGDGGSFTLDVPLAVVGDNKLTVTASRTGELKNQTNLSVTRLPAVAIKTPASEVGNGLVRIEGTVDPSFSVTVFGERAAVNSETGAFSYPVSLLDGEKTYSVSVVVRNGSGTVVYNKNFSVAYIGPETAYKRRATRISYGELEKGADRYKGTVVKYTGQVQQIQEDASGGGYMRVAVNRDSWGYWDDIIYVWYSGKTTLVNDDIVTFWGDIYGDYTYTSIAGWKITIPAVTAKYLKEGW